MKLIAWTSDAHYAALRELLPKADITHAASGLDFLAVERGARHVNFVDEGTIGKLDSSCLPGPIIALCDESVHKATAWLGAHGWLAHIISSGSLQQPHVAEHLQHVLESLERDRPPRLLEWIGKDVVGRRVRLAQASRRAERLERMTEFYATHGVRERTIHALRDAAEELLTNAFYDAPVAAGVLSTPIPRTRDVCLPDDAACDLSYGCREDLAIVRVRDPFGSLTRARLVEVLSRCASADMQVQVDETMGGAGLGLWRIFSAASMVAISVAGDLATDILVAMWKRPSGPRQFAFHLFFGQPPRRSRWRADETVTTTVKLLPT